MSQGKTLVTGAGGFLGRALVARLRARGEPNLVAGARRDEPGTVALDLMRPAEIARAVEGVTTIYHLAASMKGAPADMFLHTVVGSRNLLDAACGKRPLRIVLVSSFAVYGVAGLPRGAVVDEETPLEPHPGRRDPYSQVKLRQERLFRDYQERHGFELTIVRPGVIYGPGGSAFSSRVGLSLFGLFLFLGGDNTLPLTYVDNCAEAIIAAGRAPQAAGQVYNVVDDDLPSCRDYLRAYRREVGPLRSLPVPYPALRLISVAVERYHRWSKGQLPAVFTPYKTATSWGGNRFDNRKLKSLGFTPPVPTAEGMRRTFAALRSG